MLRTTISFYQIGVDMDRPLTVWAGTS